MKRSALLFFIALAAVRLVAPATAQLAAYRILITNDDGVRAPGLAALAQALKALGDVIIVAPADDQSGISQALTAIQPIFATTSPFQVVFARSD